MAAAARGGEGGGVYLIGGGERLSTFVDDDDNSPAPLILFSKEGLGTTIHIVIEEDGVRQRKVSTTLAVRRKVVHLLAGEGDNSLAS